MDGKIVQTIKTEYEFDLDFKLSMDLSLGGGELHNCLGKLYKNNSNEVTSQELSDYIKNNFDSSNRFRLYWSFGFTNTMDAKHVVLGNDIYYSSNNYVVRVGFVEDGQLYEYNPNSISFTINNQTCRQRLSL